MILHTALKVKKKINKPHLTVDFSKCLIAGLCLIWSLLNVFKSLEFLLEVHWSTHAVFVEMTVSLLI